MYENGDISTIKIYNIKGFLLKTIKGIQNLDTSELKSGYYIIVFLLLNDKIKIQFIKM
ncbi:hypothetical protein Q73A0000_12815 [Kaistella flava (ex Peng et al. 2021)]|uniref:Secretion system C-terminal sorting domain-containing protein n=1 Tax=Kaistella flava (ex Peng et al. 2021) TaxID=2038776 RepID=A0A7M2YAN8_9FLAO|nr:hypothetical protein Q73A0000_12815 [Kaistella flava (ex Peng et al. 2021)]